MLGGKIFTRIYVLKRNENNQLDETRLQFRNCGKVYYNHLNYVNRLEAKISGIIL